MKKDLVNNPRLESWAQNLQTILTVGLLGLFVPLWLMYRMPTFQPQFIGVMFWPAFGFSWMLGMVLVWLTWRILRLARWGGGSNKP